MCVQMVGNASLGNPNLKISPNQGLTLVTLSTKQSRTDQLCSLCLQFLMDLYLEHFLWQSFWQSQVFVRQWHRWDTASLTSLMFFDRCFLHCLMQSWPGPLSKSWMTKWLSQRWESNWLQACPWLYSLVLAATGPFWLPRPHRRFYRAPNR